jgi:hypothetical protein
MYRVSEGRQIMPTAGGAKPGSGKNFKALVAKLKKQGHDQESAEAIAASIGRKKYGKERFQRMAAKARKRK